MGKSNGKAEAEVFEAEEFDASRREAFLKAIRGGVRSIAHAAKLVGISPQIVRRWLDIGRGQCTAQQIVYRRFALDYATAASQRETIGDTVIMSAASAGDWRAAEAYQRRTERLFDQAERKRIAAAQAAEAEAEARAAKHKERILSAQADLAERGASPTANMVMFPPHFIERLEAKDPAKAKVLRETMIDMGVMVAPPKALEAVVKSRDEGMAVENAKLAIEFGIAVPSFEPELDSDTGS